MSIYDHKTLRTSTLLDEAPELDVNFLIGLQEYNLSLDDLDSLDESVLAETVAMKDALTVREFVNYLKNSDIIDDELFDINDYSSEYI